MGTSNWQNISYNIELIRKLDPITILDVGVGFGRWGILFREFLEIWDNGRYNGKWQRVIDGVEIFPDYIKDYHKYFYDEIYLINAIDYLRNTHKVYELINFGDVIEHLTKEEGKELIELALTKGRSVLINIPIGKHWAQEGTPENPYEEHKSIWYNNDFTQYKYHKIKTFYDLTKREFSVILLSLEKITYTKKYGKYFRLKNILKHRFGLKKLVGSFEQKRK
ncbi:MAG: class I SAM-dependent methyltransferase [Ignavibacteria bacterium]